MIRSKWTLSLCLVSWNIFFVSICYSSFQFISCSCCLFLYFFLNNATSYIFDFKNSLIIHEKDNHGRLIVLDTKINGANLVLTNLYAPNDISQQVQFFEKVMNKLSNYADENIIIGGDFNCPLTELDKIGWKPVQNKKHVRDKISQLSDLYSLQEVWRELNPKMKQFTWRGKAYKVQCRLDYFLASQNLANLA